MTTVNELVQKAAASGQIAEGDLALLNELARLEEKEKGQALDEGVSIEILPTTRRDGKPITMLLRRVSDGSIRPVPTSMVMQKLKQRLLDGRQAWIAPDAPYTPPPYRRRFPCPLMPEHPDHEKYQELGYAPCERIEGLSTQQAVSDHVRLKHKYFWGDMQKLQDNERQDTRDSAIVRGIAGVVKSSQPRQPHRKRQAAK